MVCGVLWLWCGCCSKMKKVTLKKVLDLKLSGRQLGNGDQLEIDKRIKAAWLGGNVFSVFPSQLFAAANTLAILDLSHNKLSVLPDAISSFIALERLFLQANLLQKLPLSLLKCELLTQVDLSGNPLVCADLSRTPLCSRLAVRTAVERLNDLQFVDRKVKLRLHRVSDLFSIETVSKGRWKELEISVNLTGEDWSLDALFDCLLDQMGVRRKFVVLLSSATLEPAVAMADSFFVSYVGPKYEACQCSLGIWNCSLHGNDLAVATALVSSESMERELLKGNVNPEHEFSNGRSLLETIVSAGRNEESVRQVELLLKFGARCTTRALEEAQEYSPMMQLLSNRVPEEDVTEDATKLIFESSTSMNEFSVGQRLGRKDDETFSGVCSRVFLAKFKGQTRCVLKIQNSFQGRTELHNSLLQEQFATEVLALQKLKSHPNIVPLLHHLRVRVDTVPDIDSAGLSTVLVFPLIERNLSQQIKFRKRRAQAPFWNNWEFSVIARELLEAVAFMQKSGVCHRDLVRCLKEKKKKKKLPFCSFIILYLFIFFFFFK